MMPFLLEQRRTVRVVVGYKAGLPVLLDGWPLAPRYYAATAQASGRPPKGNGKNGKGKGKGKGKKLPPGGGGSSGHGSRGPSRSNSPVPRASAAAHPSAYIPDEVPRAGWEDTFPQTPNWWNGLSLTFSGLRQRCKPLFDAGLITVSTIDSTQGGEADLLIFATTRSNYDRQWGFLDNRQRANVAFTRGRSGVIVVGDGRMFEAACDSQMHLLSLWGRAAGLWVQFLHPDNAGRRGSLEHDPAFDSIQDLAQEIQDHVSTADKAKLKAEKQERDEAKRVERARDQRDLGFASYMDAPLDEGFDWQALSAELMQAASSLLMAPALGVCLYRVMSLHPHEHWVATQPTDAERYDRKIWSQLGFLFDLYLGLDGGNFVYTAVWAALVKISGLGSDKDAEDQDIAGEQLPPRPGKQGQRVSRISDSIIPPGMPRKHPAAWMKTTCWCSRHRAAPDPAHMDALFGILPEGSYHRHHEGPGGAPPCTQPGCGQSCPRCCCRSAKGARSYGPSASQGQGGT